MLNAKRICEPSDLGAKLSFTRRQRDALLQSAAERQQMFSQLYHNSRRRPSSYLVTCPITVSPDHQLRRDRLLAEDNTHTWFTLQVTVNSFQMLFVALARSSHASAEFPRSNTRSSGRSSAKKLSLAAARRNFEASSFWHLLSLLPGNPILVIFGCNWRADRVRVDESPLI